jgi:tetratricopeptide (TPR) repeat protein
VGFSAAGEGGSVVVGEAFGRYLLIRLLGSGGMGHVYQAWDQELGEAVALKTIRPEFASRADAYERFKRELSVARLVTHKNVVRIHDLGQVGPIKFISMSFIDGIDLATMVSRGVLPRDLALSIVRQVCEGLAAAHQAGVAHRDLKPANIMIDRAGQAYLTDFGLARSVEATQYTVQGQVLGTIDYMSPEQALGEAADARSDIYALGIILFELFTGERPFRGENAMSRLSQRLHKPPPDPRASHPDLPEYLAKMIQRCLERDPALRYQHVEDILADLDAHQAAARPWRTVWRRVAASRVAIAALVLFVLATGGYLARRAVLRSPASPANPAASVPSIPAVSLAILPFHNASGDPSLDWLGSSLAEMLRTDVGQSSQLRTLSSARLDQILRDLRIPSGASFDEATLRRMAEFSDAETLVWGQYTRFGDRVRIDATLKDVKRDRSIPLKVEAPTEKDLLRAIDELAQAIQQNVASSPDVLKELRAKAFRPSSTSVQALRYYNEGVQLARQGNNLEAKKRFEASIKDDPAFALAHAELGQTYASLGYDNEAEDFSRKAVDLGDKLPPQEKYLVRAIHARTAHDTRTAIESYENLAKVLPNDSDIGFNLAALYENTGDFDKARDTYARVLERDPKHVDALLAIGRVEIRRRNPQKSLDYLNSALTLAINLENDEERGAILQAMGVAYKRLDKLDDALRYYQQSLEIKRRIGDKRGMASSLNEIAQVEDRLGRSDESLKSYNEALQLRRGIGDKRGVGDTLIDLGNFNNRRGRYDQALKLFKESLPIQREVGNAANQALCLNNIGSAYLAKGQYEDARTNYELALQLREKAGVPGDIAQTLFNLGEVSSDLGQYDESLRYRLRAIDLWRRIGDKRGVALASHGIAVILGYQGQFGAALGAEAEALKNLRELRDQFWVAEVLGSYANILGQMGKADEARKSLEEALSGARSLNNQDLIARTLAYQGDTFYYVGDFQAALPLYEQARDAAARSTDRGLVLASKIDVLKIAVKEQRPDAVPELKRLAAEADTAGLKFLSNQTSLLVGEALLNAKQYPAARQELQRVVSRSDRMGLREVLARAHFLLATVAGNDADTARHFAEARRLVEEIRKESGSADLIRRVDLGPILTAPSR